MDYPIATIECNNITVLNAKKLWRERIEYGSKVYSFETELNTINLTPEPYKYCTLKDSMDQNLIITSYGKSLYIAIYLNGFEADSTNNCDEIIYQIHLNQIQLIIIQLIHYMLMQLIIQMIEQQLIQLHHIIIQVIYQLIVRMITIK